MILSDEVLREAGIADLLINVGRMSKEEEKRLMTRIERKKQK